MLLSVYKMAHGLRGKRGIWHARTKVLASSAGESGLAGSGVGEAEETVLLSARRVRWSILQFGSGECMHT